MSNIIFTLVSRGFGWNLMREIFTSLDGAIFSLFSAVIQLMFDIVKVTASDTFFNDIQSRIYVILSIYMLFKVTISLITYVVNPDSMTDKGQGVGKLVQRIMISIVMLIAFPMVFQKLTQYQSDIIESGTIDNIILGAQSINDQQDAGDKIGVAVYDGFIIRDANTNLTDSSISTVGLNKVSDATRIVNEPMSADQKEVYKYEYIPLIGFAVGVLMTLLILSFCIDLAMRVFKLIILQLIAPIPIISYIDPKASKDGAFSKWIKMVGTTWASLFVRLVVIDFILLLIKEVIGDGSALQVESGGIMVKIALVIGLLYFAKNLPKFIGDALGIKIEGGLFTGLGQIAAAGAIVGGSVLSAGQDFTNRLKTEGAGSAFKNIGRSLFTGVGAGFTGLGVAYAGKGMADVNEARKKYLNNRMNYISKDVERDKFAHDRMKNVFDKATNLKKIMDDEAAKTDEYKLFSANLEAAKNGDRRALEWLANSEYASNFTRQVTSTRRVGKGGRAHDEVFTENVVDIAAASVYQENLLHNIGDTMLNNQSNSSINDALSMYNDAATDARTVRVDGQSVKLPTIDSRASVGKAQGASGHAMNVIERKAGYKGAGRRKG